MGGDNELRVGKVVLEQLTELIAMVAIDGHDNVVQQSKSKALSEETLHEREVEAKSHTVLVALAVIGPWRERAPTVKVHIETKFADRRPQVCLNLSSSS